MNGRRVTGSVEALRRKLKALTAVARDAGVTAHEKANAEALRARLERQLKEAGTPAGDWTDNLFRLGRRVREIKDAGLPGSPSQDWTGHAFRLGKALRRGLNKLK